MDAEDLIAWRKRLGMSQPRAAEALGLATITLRQYEQQRRKIPPIVDRACRGVEANTPIMQADLNAVES